MNDKPITINVTWDAANHQIKISGDVKDEMICIYMLVKAQALVMEHFKKLESDSRISLAHQVPPHA
jgi:hypothetical protein